MTRAPRRAAFAHCAILLLASVAIHAADDPTEKAKRLVVPRVDLNEATVHEALRWLELKSKEIDPEKQGVKFILTDLPESARNSDRIYVSLSNASIFEIASRISLSADLRLHPAVGAFRVEAINREQAPPPAGDESKIEGAYASAPDLTGQTLKLKNGRFQFTTWHDVLGMIKGEAGTYRREGRRIILLGDKPDYVDSAVWAEFDGVPLLFNDTNAYRIFVESGGIMRDGIMHRAWDRLDKHPRLANKLNALHSTLRTSPDKKESCVVPDL